MKIHAYLSLLAVCCLMSAGCKRGAAVPNDSFQVTVEPLIAERDLVVSLVHVQAPSGISVSIDSKYSHSMINLTSASGGAAKDVEVALTASRMAMQGQAFASIQNFIGIKQDGDSDFTGGTMGNSIPATTALAAYFSISVTNGDYTLGTPLEIGRLDGKPVTLTVGKPAAK